MTSPDNGRAAALSETTAASGTTTGSGTIDSGMADGPLAGGGPHGVTREMLQADEIRRRFARLYPHIHILDDAELAQSLEEMLDTAPPGAFAGGAPRLFGYGSLMWNPCVAITERRRARVVGLHRSFCLWMPFGRGTPDQPGLMLALDRGGSCTAMTLMPDPADWRAELALIWRREMLTASYLPRWVSAQTPDGPVPALTFVINPAHERYAGRLTEDQTARIIAHATGELGSSADYLRACVGALDAAGIHDRRMVALLSRVEYHQQAYTDMPQDISGR
ncbi:gamma-glutamylcyclotransferase [Tistrella mobilis]|uniref:gamma-glutamylcyclotransferase n=1 Tax=Tistrella mobilis TaxID=171437 RepID=UPI0035569ABE